MVLGCLGLSARCWWHAAHPPAGAGDKVNVLVAVVEWQCNQAPVPFEKPNVFSADGYSLAYNAIQSS